MIRREEFDNNPEEFSKRFESDNQSLAWSILAARELLGKVKITDHLRKFISDLSVENNVAGHRADIVMEQAAKALAALNRRLHVTVQDIKEVAPMVLIHRRREAAPPPPPPPPPPPKEENNNDQSEEDSKPPEEQHQNQQSNTTPSDFPQERTEELEPQTQEESDQRHNLPEGENSTDYKTVLERIFEIGETFKVRKLSAPKSSI
jgi:magnesium chelatase subunit D